MRISISSWATTDENVERSADAMMWVARTVLARTASRLGCK